MKNKIHPADIAAGIIVFFFGGCNIYIIAKQWSTLLWGDVIALILFSLLLPVVFWGKNLKNFFKKILNEYKMKKNIFFTLVLFCPLLAHAQERSWLMQATTFSIPGEGYLIEPEVTFCIEDEFSFHEFSFNASGNICALNGIVLGKSYPYVYLSYNPAKSYSYSSIGLSRDITLGSNLGAIGYFEIGITDAEYKNWSIGAGMIYSLQFPSFGRKKKR